MSNDGTENLNYGVLTNRLAQSGQWDRAFSASIEWLSKEPENLVAHRTAAQSLVHLNRAAEAASYINRVLAGNPKDDYAHRLMSISHFVQGNSKSAFESINKALEINPRDAYHWYQAARLSHCRGDLVTARKSAEKARELQPRDPDILNFLVMCEPDGPDGARRKIAGYEQALELDPENANILNNIGVQYLKLKEFAKAEEFFRKALFFDPSSKLFAKNLLIALKHRDKIYRALCAPKDFLIKARSLIFQPVKSRLLVGYIVVAIIWLIAFRFIFLGLALWFLFFWPVTKFYEYLTIGDLRRRAGEVGVQRAGAFGVLRWPLEVRMGLFATFLILFWSYLACFWKLGTVPFTNNGSFNAVDLFFALAIIFFLCYRLKLIVTNGFNRIAAHRQARQLDCILIPQNAKRKWWQFFWRRQKSP